MSNELRIGLVIADLEMRFSTTFKTCSNDYYGVTFENSDVIENLNKLNRLLELVSQGCNYKGYMRFKITREDVETIIKQFSMVVSRYNELYGPVPRQMKVYALYNILREAEKPTAEQIANQALAHILTPQKTTKKPTKQESAENLSKERQLKRIRKGKK